MGRSLRLSFGIVLFETVLEGTGPEETGARRDRGPMK